VRVRPPDWIAEPKNTTRKNTTPYSLRCCEVVVFSTEEAFKYIGSEHGLSDAEIRALVEGLTLIAQIAIDRTLSNVACDEGIR
jgi:hypothetical protein